MEKASAAGGQRGKQPSLAGGGWAVLALIALVAVVPRGDPEPAEEARPVPNDVTVTLSIRGHTDLSRVIHAGDAITGTAEQLARSDDRRATRNVRFVLKLEGRDRYGNDELWPFLTLTYAMADLRKVNYDKIESWAMLDLAREVTAEGGYTYRAVATYCAEMTSPGFCAKAR